MLYSTSNGETGTVRTVRKSAYHTRCLFKKSVSRHFALLKEKFNLSVDNLSLICTGATMEWSNDLVLQFLEYYRDEGVIWNPSWPEHKNRNNIYDAWKRIQFKMEEKYSISELKKKKDSLMASFRTCCNKVKASIRSGAAGVTVYKPNWYAYAKMATFLLDKDDPCATINSEELQDDPKNAVELEDNVNEAANNEEVILVSLPVTKKRKRDSDAHSIKEKLGGAYSVLQTTLQNRAAKERTISDIFGELVAEKLKRLDDSTREVAMHRIDNILFELRPTANATPTPPFPS